MKKHIQHERKWDRDYQRRLQPQSTDIMCNNIQPNEAKICNEYSMIIQI